MRVREKKVRLYQLKGQIRPGALDNLEQVHRIDITYTSNALEGNCLTAGETALIIEKGIAVGGKPLRDHLEAINYGSVLGEKQQPGAGHPTPIREDSRLSAEDINSR